MSLGQLTVDVNAHKSSTTHQGSPLDQITEGIHHPVSITRSWPNLRLVVRAHPGA
ncbi:hypothetical protein PHYBLDRAFT_139480 [Phycomyces blakesleeanus NRRL 1555(-)]|uniref:Uncharacterized protein n=1 Tax=Phycomyces blakesleeanus (strain ATCC 8743b / DSM 1359 / FGSC 10004 / NBRC 33097 / NRRL 1555) TaxID=763407 RepID=A0A167QBZ3_PHYB8|nr:hypothetical protein PHYBLDRAFT_139480 [Phycomyces blakesleeanus NRRL 1555(-)]OAD79449.1 hypothetical protein PHYBLDRAFT_139480 [Phycomyces blakesleeanus NRRL 1555(-)]|eukprot:XP_018297489.1 hypothetical protein PHYBLDRAFT_139480 [Phycomyces blakesleeanus NRRL 1555(-)]